MHECHTVDFAQCSFNVLSDGERQTLTLQFDLWNGKRKAIAELLEALRRRFGAGVTSRLRRWWANEQNPVVLPRRTERDLAGRDVFCYEIRVRDGETVDAALGVLLGFLRQRPGYQHIYGAPLDPDRDVLRPRYPATADDASASAHSALMKLMKTRRR